MKDKIDAMAQSAAQSAKDLAGKAQEKAGDGATAAKDALGRLGALGPVSAEMAKTIADVHQELIQEAQTRLRAEAAQGTLLPELVPAQVVLEETARPGVLAPRLPSFPISPKVAQAEPPLDLTLPPSPVTEPASDVTMPGGAAQARVASQLQTPTGPEPASSRLPVTPRRLIEPRT